MRTRGTDEVERLGELTTQCDAACLTVVPASMGLPALAAHWRIDIDAPVEVTPDGPPYDPSGRSLHGYVWFIQVGHQILVVEENGFTGDQDELLARLSEESGGARVASAFWNVNAVVRFGAAEGGRTIVPSEEVRHGEPTPPEAAELDDLLAPFRALPEPPEEGPWTNPDVGPSWEGTAVAMLLRWTGMTLPDDLFDLEAHTVYLWSR
ncbi:hypothetical protein QE364_000222 [Nocardioides zeae]|uniref:Uncharacterized protein n=1 Tax=Nocardioides zeae TaxID=1457234 RepID=A0ACC6ICY0_9ACTN|nr:hypothetical protein [Nocardioides zeae]MDR6208534.1 hypothetical protein [Nocardioides zeae]